jgi:hypothetical protein
LSSLSSIRIASTAEPRSKVKDAVTSGGPQTTPQALKALAQAFLASPEFSAQHPVALTGTQLVTLMYSHGLGRAPDPQGLAFWQSALTQHGSAAEVAAAISQSMEAQVHLVGVVESGWHLS